MPKAKKADEVKCLTREQIQVLIEAAPAYWRPYFLVAVTTGLRRGDMAGLTWEDVFWDEHQVRVRYQLRNGKLTEPKTNESKWRVDVGADTLDALARQREACPATDLGLVFPTEAGKPIHPSNFHRSVWAPTLAASGLSGFVPHDLRHTFGSVLMQRTADPMYVQKMMRHASASTTMDVYGHTLPRKNNRAADRFRCLAF